MIPNLFALLAPVALALPTTGPVIDEALEPNMKGSMDAAALTGGSAATCSAAIRASLPPSSKPRIWSATIGAIAGSDPLSVLNRDHIAHQVRIERRVIIRISPRREESRVGPGGTWRSNRSMHPRGTRLREVEMEPCVQAARIAGVQTGTGNRLLLFLNDDRIVSLNLERACRARDFYSGFYVERHEDGMICIKRDLLKSRSGATCEVDRMRRLVAADD